MWLTQTAFRIAAESRGPLLVLCFGRSPKEKPYPAAKDKEPGDTNLAFVVVVPRTHYP